jgi:phospholipid/cholesterol/gamma-HCH transport system substrate-binding protein
MKHNPIAFLVGLFLMIGIASLAYLSISIARNDFLTPRGHEVHAFFNNGNGLRNGSPVLIAGVEVGRVKSISLHDFEAKVVFTVHPDIALPIDTMASIRTRGLIGEKFLELSPGGDDAIIAAGGLLRNTEPSMDIEGLISRFIQGSLNAPTTSD